MTRTEEKRIFEMAEAAVDHEARKVLAGLEKRQDHLEKSIEDMKASNKLFETETRTALSNILERQTMNTEKVVDKIEASTMRIHMRIDNWIKLALLGTLGLVVSLGVYIWKSQVG